MKFSYGGQAVIEGVMMLGRKQMAVSVRAPNGEIIIRSEALTSKIFKSKLVKLPLLRGLIMLWVTLTMGVKTMSFAANIAMLDPKMMPKTVLKALVMLLHLLTIEADDTTTTTADTNADTAADSASNVAQIQTTDEFKLEETKITGFVMGGTVLASLVFVIAIFFVGPSLLAEFLGGFLQNALAVNLIEGALRLAIFLGYLWLIGRMPDVRRVFQYHGAEHKTINAYEAGAELEPEIVQKYSTVHTRCGTSFLLLVVVISILVLAPLGRPPLPILLLTRILSVPIIATFAYEYIKWSANHYGNAFIRALMQPGLLLQKLTTREPELEMLQVAITSLENVLVADGVRTQAQWEQHVRLYPVRPMPVPTPGPGVAA
jgi:uncharacterized protein YqhQ